jgi:hypothetical protein
MSAERPYLVCPNCGAPANREPFDSLIRNLYRCANGHTIVTLVNPIRHTEEILAVSS